MVIYSFMVNLEWVDGAVETIASARAILSSGVQCVSAWASMALSLFWATRVILVEDTVPRCAVTDGQSVKPADVGVLTVVEQTAGHAPKRDSMILASCSRGKCGFTAQLG
jgi:hypothetical protein